MADASLFAHLDSPLVEELLFFCEPRDKDAASELDRVKALRKLFRKHFPRCRLVAVPNGVVRSQRMLNQAVSEGASWGFPDLLAIGNVRFVPMLEMKSGTGALKAHQVAWMNWLARNGHHVGMFRKPETAIEWLFQRGFR